MWGDEYSSLAHAAAEDQLFSRGGALKYIIAIPRQSTSEINGLERCGESNHTNPTLFHSFHPCCLSLSIIQGERISKRRQV